MKQTSRNTRLWTTFFHRRLTTAVLVPPRKRDCDDRMMECIRQRLSLAILSENRVEITIIRDDDLGWKLIVMLFLH
jgi:hypothetical protein